MPPEVLLITGAPGVGKSTVSWEVCAQLERRGLPHAAIDTDELDRVWPLDLLDPRRRSLNLANLSSRWSRFRDLGVERVVLAGAFIALPDALDWIGEALPRRDPGRAVARVTRHAAATRRGARDRFRLRRAARAHFSTPSGSTTNRAATKSYSVPTTRASSRSPFGCAT